MRQFFQRIQIHIKTDFIKISFSSGLATLIKMLTSFVSIKVVSKHIGPPGMALVGQFLNVISMVSALGTGCIGQGVTKYIAEYHNKPQEQEAVIGNATRITLVCTLIVSLITILSANILGNYVFHTHEYDFLIVLFGLSLSLYTFNTLIIQILNGFKAFKKYIMVNITASLSGLIISIILVIYLGLYGALLNCILSQSVILGVTLFFVYREPWFRLMFRKMEVSKDIIRKLGAFALMMLITSLLLPYAQITIRNAIISKTSLNSAGIWDSMNRLSGMYLLLVTTSISTYYLPRLSEIHESTQLRLEIIKSMKIVLPFFAIICLMVYLFKRLIINIVFTSEFLPMEELFTFQVIGDFFKIASWMLAYVFWAKAMTRVYIIMEVVFTMSFILLATQGINLWGLQGAVIGYAVNYIIYFIVLIILFHSILKR